MIRVILPFHLRTLAHVGSEVTLEVTDLKPGAVTQRSVLDAGIVRKARPAIPCCVEPSATTTRNSPALFQW
jgi:ribosomal protein L14